MPVGISGEVSALGTKLLLGLSEGGYKRALSLAGETVLCHCHSLPLALCLSQPCRC